MITVATHDNEVLGFPDEMSIDDIQQAISDDKNGTITAPKQNLYNNVFAPAFKSLNSIFEPNFFLANRDTSAQRAFATNMANSGTFGAIRPMDMGELYKEHPVASVAGQFAGFAAPMKAIGVGLQALRFPALVEMAVKPLQAAAEKLPQFAPLLQGATKAVAGGMQAGASMGVYGGAAEAVNQLETQDHLDLQKVGAAALHDAMLWGAAGSVSGALTKPLAGLNLGEQTAQVIKDMHVTAGTLYLAAKAGGSDDKDALLQAGMGAVYHLVHVAGDSLEARKYAMNATEKMISDYVKAKNPMVHDFIAERGTQEHMMNEAENVIAESKDRGLKEIPIDAGPAAMTTAGEITDKTSPEGSAITSKTDDVSAINNLRNPVDIVADDHELTRNLVDRLTKQTSGVDTSSASADGEKKEPWQMTRAEYNKLNNVDEEELPNYHGTTEAAKQKILSEGFKDFSSGTSVNQDSETVKDYGPATIKAALKKDAQLKFPELGEGLNADTFRSEDVIPDHEEYVKKAIAEGKDVPADVLADYPDINKDPLASASATSSKQYKENPDLEPLKSDGQKRSIAEKKAEREAMLKVQDAKEAREAVVAEIRERRYALNLANYETNLFTHDIAQKTTREQREIIPFLIEGTEIPKELGRKDLEAQYEKDKENPQIMAIVDAVKQHFDEKWRFIQDNTDQMTAQQVENYVTHIWDVNPKQKMAVSNWFTTQNKFLKKRFIATLEEGIKKFGLKPKTLDINTIVQMHDNIANKVIENKKFVKWLKDVKTEDGTPLVAPSHEAPKDWEAIYHPALEQKVIVPGDKKLGEKITPELQDILTEMGVAIGRRIAPMAFGKPSRVAGLYYGGRETPEIRLQRFFETSTIAHEIGHHIDSVMKLGENFLSRYKDELYALNKDRIEAHKGIPGKYGAEYANSSEEQIAEFFAKLFTDPEGCARIAPGATEEMLDRLKRDGVLSKLVDFDFEAKAKRLIEESTNTMLSVPLKVHPDLVNPLRVIFDSRFNHPAINAYEMVNGYLKKSILSLSLFHHAALSESFTAATNPLNTLKMLNPLKGWDGLVKGEYKAFTDQPLARRWIGAGLQVGATEDIPTSKIQGQLNDLAFKTKDVAFINHMTEFLSSFNEKWDAALWSYLHDTMKLTACEHLGMKVDPNKDVKIQEREIAQFVNDVFGGQNWENLMVSPKTRQIMSWVLLSPDWTVSKIREGLAPTGLGSISKEGKALRASMGSMYWIKAALYFGVGMNLLNAALRKKDFEDHPELYTGRAPQNLLDYTMFGNTIGHKTHLFAGRYSDGTERYIRWGKQFREIPELFYDDLGFSPISASLKKLGGKISPAIQLTSQVFSGYSPSGFKNRDIADNKGWDRVGGIMKTLAMSPLPMSSQNLLSADKEFHASDIIFPSSKGMSRYQSIELMKMGIEKYLKSGDDRLIKETYQDTLNNNLPPYVMFTAAIKTIKAEQTKEINSNIKSIEDLEKEEAKNKNPEIAKILQRKRKMLEKESSDKKYGLEKYEKAIFNWIDIRTKGKSDYSRSGSRRS